jgi:hypothetical protein
VTCCPASVERIKTMNNEKSLINIGDWGKAATMLIEKISGAIGGCFRPFQIKRVARAEAEADRIKAIAQIETQIEVTDITRRALGRFLIEETKKQDNMESIISKALPLLEDNSRPQEIDDDWVNNFFDKCRLISDIQMQTLWAKVLAGEANSPGKYSKRTVNFLGSIDKSDATLFTNLCGFGWFLGDIVPLIYMIDAPIYKEYGIRFDNLRHLDDIGLLSFEPIGEYKRMGFPKIITVFYYGIQISIEFNNEKDNHLDIGHVLLSKTGQELAEICNSKPISGFLDYIIKIWLNKELKLSSPYPK